MVWPNRPTDCPFAVALGWANVTIQRCKLHPRLGQDGEPRLLLGRRRGGARARHARAADREGRAEFRRRRCGRRSGCCRMAWHGLRGGGLRHVRSRRWTRRTQPMQRSEFGFCILWRHIMQCYHAVTDSTPEAMVSILSIGREAKLRRYAACDRKRPKHIKCRAQLRPQAHSPTTCSRSSKVVR